MSTIIMSFTTSIIKQVRVSANLENFKAILCHPKLIFVENNNLVRIVNLSNDEEQIIELNEEIVDVMNQENFLWLVLKSHKMIIIDIISHSQINVSSNYKINRFENYNGTLFFISESGESFLCPYSTQNLKDKFGEGASEENVCLEKSQILLSDSSSRSEVLWQGLSLYNGNDGLVLKCPVTEISESVATKVPVQNLISWDNVLVLVHDLNMWIVDLQSAKMLFGFSNIGAKYYPMSIYNNMFYYTTWNHSEVISMYNNKF